jgi:glycosyltransferase involved in cell wall biosynthesis
MRIAFIGHAYHQKTRSSRFLIDLLEQHATVDLLFGEPGSSASWSWAAAFDENAYDAIIVFQLHEAFDLLSGRHPNVTFVPMYDAMFWAGEFYWTSAFNKAKIACFSWTLRQEVMRHGAVHAGFQYYPDPAGYPLVDDFSTLHGFFWYRTLEITPAHVFRLCRGTQFERFTVHDAPDPGQAAEGGWTAPPNIGALDVTRWSADRNAYAASLRDANVFFAPRLLEGIGMSVLEAMASGMCVASPDTPTMNEYISNGTNGLLYVRERATPLDFADARRIGARARESIARGHQRWLTSIPALLDFITTPTAIVRAGARTLIPVRNRFETDPPPAPAGRPLVSVVTVCRNAEAELEATITNVLGQTGCDFEYVVVDGDSTDGTLDIIHRHADRIAAWRSTQDNGPYDAMNAALELVRGEWVLFMNAGDSFASEDALQRMFAHVPAGTDVVYGHHIYRREDHTEELRHAAEFETTWSRLQRGDLWFDWLSGIPCHQATAIRRDLLAQLRFDPRYQIAADHDVMFRARAGGARFFNCDEVIAIYVAGGLSAQKYERCRQEWAEIARTYGDSAAADRFYAHLEAVSTASGSISQIARLRRMARRVIAGLDRLSPPMARGAERILRSARLRRILRPLLRRSPLPPGEPNAFYEADLLEGIDFSQPGLPDMLSALDGVSHAETWGRWTNGPTVTLRFRAPLPQNFDLILAAHALSRNADRPVEIRVGRMRAKVKISGRPDGRYQIALTNPDAVDTLVLRIPAPASPNKLWPGQSSDCRAVGLALVHLKIVVHETRPTP